MTLEELPGRSDEVLAVEVLNADGIPVARVGLIIIVDVLPAEVSLFNY